MAITKTANAHKTSTLVSSQVPDFVQEDHPLFVTFIESYYDFLAQANSGILTSDGSDSYYGADYAAKILPDAADVDTTDFNVFLESFRRQYAPNFPQSTHANVNDRTLYKNLINFYRAVGTDDSFKMLFRLLYNEEIEIYYPKDDVLIASGGNYSKQKRISVAEVDNLSNIATINKKIIGETSGAYGTIERVEILPKTFMNFRSGQIANVSSSASFTSANTNMEAIYDPDYLREIQLPRAYLYLTSVVGNFEFHETLYVDDASFANTILLPQTDRILFFDPFDTRDLDGTINSANAVISINSGRSWRSEKSTGPPWSLTSNISYGNTGMWFSSEGTGQIALVANVGGSTGYKVLQVGNNSTSALDKTLSDAAFTYGSFPGYGEANGIGGVGATGNVSFIKNHFAGVPNSHEVAIVANNLVTQPFIGPSGDVWTIKDPSVTQGSWGSDYHSIDLTEAFGLSNAYAYVMYTDTDPYARFSASTGGGDLSLGTGGPFVVADFGPDSIAGYSNNFCLVMWDDRPTIPLDGTGGGWGQTWRVLGRRSEQIYSDVWPGYTLPFVPDSANGDFIIARVINDDGGAIDSIDDWVVHPDALPKTAYFDEKRRLTFTGDQRHLVLNHNIGIGGEDRLYRMTVRARDLGGNSAISVPEGNRFSAGLECLGRNLNIISANNYNDAWGNSHWVVSDHQSIDDTWFTYIGHFKGRQSKRSSDLISYIPENHGSGGRHDLPVAGKHYNSLSDAIDGNVRLPYGTTFIRPALRINEPSSDTTYSQGITQIDYIQIEELTPIQSQFGIGGEYLDDASLLSTRGAFLQDNLYRQTYAYDIRSKQQVKTYESIVKSTTHPAGLKMFGTTISESSRRTSDHIDLVATNLANLTSFADGASSSPAWSPDGTKIAFDSRKDSANSDIYYMDADGTNVVRVTNDQPATGNNYYPDWSPDGTELVFESRTDGSAIAYPRDIYAIKIDGTDLRRLTTNTYFSDTDPTFSPDGKKIAFQRWEPATSELLEAHGWAPGSSAPVGGIMIMDASDGGNKKLLTPMYPYENSPSWSPDGKKIAYRKHFGTTGSLGGGALGIISIWSVDVDGSNPTEIYRHPLDSDYAYSDRLYYPAWSPDGTKIAVHGATYGIYQNRDISVIMNADNPGDARLVQLTTNTSSDSGASWSPDGTKIAFHSNRSDAANNEIWVMDVSQPRSDTNLLDTFSPDSLDSLAGWFKAESISPENVDNLRYTTNVVGTHTATNIMPPGISDFPGTGSPIENHLTLSATGGRTPFTASIDYGDWAVGSPSSLKIQTPTTASDGSTWLENAIYFGDGTQLDDANIIVPVANTKWLFSCYIKSSNVSPGFHVSLSADGIFRAYTRLANTSRYGGGGVVDWSGTSGMVSQADTWTRVSGIFDFDSNLINVTSNPADQNSRRALLVMDFGNPNSTYHIDGLMLERYDESMGTTPGAYTPSPYVQPSLNGADVMSWYDSSPNKLHAYANTSMVFGSQWKPPMFLANTGTGHPVVTFKSNNVSYGEADVVNLMPRAYSMFDQPLDDYEFTTSTTHIRPNVLKTAVVLNDDGVALPWPAGYANTTGGTMSTELAEDTASGSGNTARAEIIVSPIGANSYVSGRALHIRSTNVVSGGTSHHISYHPGSVGSLSVTLANAHPGVIAGGGWQGDGAIRIPTGKRWIVSYWVKGWSGQGFEGVGTIPDIARPHIFLRKSWNADGSANNKGDLGALRAAGDTFYYAGTDTDTSSGNMFGDTNIPGFVQGEWYRRWRVVDLRSANSFYGYGGYYVSGDGAFKPINESYNSDATTPGDSTLTNAIDGYYHTGTVGSLTVTASGTAGASIDGPTVNNAHSGFSGRTHNLVRLRMLANTWNDSAIPPTAPGVQPAYSDSATFSETNNQTTRAILRWSTSEDPILGGEDGRQTARSWSAVTPVVEGQNPTMYWRNHRIPEWRERTITGISFQPYGTMHGGDQFDLDYIYAAKSLEPVANEVDTLMLHFVYYVSGQECYIDGVQVEEVSDTTVTTPSTFVDPNRVPMYIYPYTTFPNDQNYMTGLQGKTSPAANTLPRPIANQFTGFAVVRTNLNANKTHYRSDVWPWTNQQIFSTGAGGYSKTGQITDGSFELAVQPTTTGNGAVSSYPVANSTGWLTGTWSQGSDVSRLPLDTDSAFRIYGISEYAATKSLSLSEGKSGDLITLHYNGRRYANSEQVWNTSAGMPSADDLTRDGMSYERQLADGGTFYIGHNQITKYDNYNSRWYWFDGDMAEIVWFNEQLNQEQIEKVEGYLAHKYGIQDDLIFRDHFNNRVPNIISVFDGATDDYAVIQDEGNYANTLNSTVDGFVYLMNQTGGDGDDSTGSKNTPTNLAAVLDNKGHMFHASSPDAGQTPDALRPIIVIDQTSGANSYPTSSGKSIRMSAKSLTGGTPLHQISLPARYLTGDELVGGLVNNTFGNPYYLFAEALDITPGLKWTVSYSYKTTGVGTTTGAGTAMRTKIRIYYADGNGGTPAQGANRWDYIDGTEHDNSALSVDTWTTHSEVFDLYTDQPGDHGVTEDKHGGSTCSRNKAIKVFFKIFVDLPTTASDPWAACWIDNIKMIPVFTEHPYKYQPPTAIRANTTPYGL